MVNSEVKLSFVLKNFSIVYDTQNIKKINVNYTSKSEFGINIPELSTNCFDENSSKEIQWKELVYKGANIPIPFLEESIDKPFDLLPNCINFHFDIISAIFYFLSGWQETVTQSEDTLGRFTFDQSIQKKLNISTFPVVNYYFLMLKEAIEYDTNTILENRISQNGFTVIVSHDIDYWMTLWRKELKHSIKTLNFPKVVQLLKKRLSNNYANDCFEKIVAYQKSFGFNSTYFFLPDTKKHMGFESADYSLNYTKVRSQIQKLSLTNEIGIHGGFTSSENSLKLKKELDKINQISQAKINRFHFLQFSMKSTPNLLESNQIVIDSTLGFNDKPGFRMGTSYPFYLFDYQQNTPSNVLEIPLILMDVTLFLEKYENSKSSEDAWKKILPILEQFRLTGGVLVLNWHNDSFVNIGREAWQKTFVDILEYCKSNKAEFSSYAAIKSKCDLAKSNCY